MHRLTIETIFITHDRHWIKGAVSTEGRRLLDVLNDPSREYLRIQDVQVSGGNRFTGIVPSPEAFIRKSNIDLAILSADEHESPQKRWDHFSAKKRNRVSVLVAGFDIKADLHRPGLSGDIQTSLFSLPGTFLPLTEVSVSPVDPRTDPFLAGVILVNRHCITLVADLEVQAENSSESVFMGVSTNSDRPLKSTSQSSTRKKSNLLADFFQTTH